MFVLYFCLIKNEFNLFFLSSDDIWCKLVLYKLSRFLSYANSSILLIAILISFQSLFNSSCSLHSSYSPTLSILFTRPPPPPYPPASSFLSSSVACLCMFKAGLTSSAALTSEEEGGGGLNWLGGGDPKRPQQNHGRE